MSGERTQHVVAQALEGNPRGIARLMTWAESGDGAYEPALAEIFAHTGRAHVVGITGVPGSGKSSLVNSLVAALRKVDRKVGVVAVDPTSPFSGGAILGDRIRMQEAAADPGVFIRSMATRGALGGLARSALDAVDILDAAGFDVVLIETVGVGQDEVDIVQAAHSVIVVSAPGLGDDIQAIKAGILEIADMHVVSKCDRADANDTVIALKAMLKLDLILGATADWTVPVLATSVTRGEGIDELLAAILGHRAYLDESGEMAGRQRRIAERRVLRIAEDIIRARFARRRDGAVSGLLERVATRRLDPHSAAHELLLTLHEEE